MAYAHAQLAETNTISGPSIGASISQMDNSLKILDEVSARLMHMEDHINSASPRVTESNNMDEKVAPSLIGAINERVSRLNVTAERLDSISKRIENLIGNIP